MHCNYSKSWIAIRNSFWESLCCRFVVHDNSILIRGLFTLQKVLINTDIDIESEL